MNKNLFIDTSGTEEITIAIDYCGKKHKKIATSRKERAQIILSLIDEILKEHNFSIHDISAIYIVLGPGSFTGLRVGVSVANALAFALGIPVNGEQKIIIPLYD